VINTPEALNLVMAYWEQAAIYYQMDEGLIDLAQLVESNTWGLSEMERMDFFNGAWTQDKYPIYASARLGYPVDSSMNMLYYNASKTLNQEANTILSGNSYLTESQP